MLFPTVDFAIFFLVVFTGHWVLRPRPRLWFPFILLASLFFYGYWDWTFIPLLLGSTVANWALARWAALTRSGGERTRATNRVVALATVANLGLLAWFKYAGFFATSAANVANKLGMDAAPPSLEVVLPIGISFFSFQALGYVIDVARGDMKTVRLIDFAVYLTFFPHLVAGPIVRASELVPGLHAHLDPRRVRSAEGFRLIAAGLIKKVVVANYLGTQIVDPVFALPEQHSSFEVLIGIYAYAIQIYADFSGYTDIAIGCALLMGLRFPQNFDAPYIATSLQDFWHRWHMSLSRWLRDYLYVPLGGNRGSERATHRNLFLTMLIGGLWHGASWTFVIWGGIHGAGLVVERQLASVWRPIGLPTPLVRVLKWLVTFNVVCLAWVFFRAETFDHAWAVLSQLVGADASGSTVTWVVLAMVGAMLLSQFVPTAKVQSAQRSFSRAPLAAQAMALAGVLLLIDVFGPVGVAPFIYFQF